MESQKKCQYPDEWSIKIGPFSTDPCRYQVIEEYPASVSILKCRKCGRSKLIWTRETTVTEGLEQHQKDLELRNKQEGIVPCSPLSGWNVSFLGQAVDICEYEVDEHYESALVSIVECVKCGFRNMHWQVLEDPKEQDFTEI